MERKIERGITLGVWIDNSGIDLVGVSAFHPLSSHIYRWDRLPN